MVEIFVICICVE